MEQNSTKTSLQKLTDRAQQTMAKLTMLEHRPTNRPSNMEIQKAKRDLQAMQIATRKELEKILRLYPVEEDKFQKLKNELLLQANRDSSDLKRASILKESEEQCAPFPPYSEADIRSWKTENQQLKERQFDEQLQATIKTAQISLQIEEKAFARQEESEKRILEITENHQNKKIAALDRFKSIQLAGMKKTSTEKLRQAIVRLKQENNSFCAAGTRCLPHLAECSRSNWKTAEKHFEELINQKDTFISFLTAFERTISNENRRDFEENLRIIKKQLREIGFKVEWFLALLENGNAPIEDSEQKSFKLLFDVLAETVDRFSMPRDDGLTAKICELQEADVAPTTL